MPLGYKQFSIMHKGSIANRMFQSKSTQLLKAFFEESSELATLPFKE